MIELEKTDNIDPTDFYGTLWTDESNEHVIAEEGGLFYVRDENGSSGGFGTFDEAFADAVDLWTDVTLAPANRLRVDIELGRTDEIGHFLLEYLATYGAVGIDVQALANRVFVRTEED